MSMGIDWSRTDKNSLVDCRCFQYEKITDKNDPLENKRKIVLQEIGLSGSSADFLNWGIWNEHCMAATQPTFFKKKHFFKRRKQTQMRSWTSQLRAKPNITEKEIQKHYKKRTRIPPILLPQLLFYSTKFR